MFFRLCGELTFSQDAVVSGYAPWTVEIRVSSFASVRTSGLRFRVLFYLISRRHYIMTEEDMTSEQIREKHLHTKKILNELLGRLKYEILTSGSEIPNGGVVTWPRVAGAVSTFSNI